MMKKEFVIDDNHYKDLPEIAAILTGNNEKAIADATLMATGFDAFSAKYGDWCEKMGYAGSYDMLQIFAYWLVGYENGEMSFGAYNDFKDSADEVLGCMEKAVANLGYDPDFVCFESYSGFNEDECFVFDGMDVVNKRLNKYGLALIYLDTGGDCYHFFIIPANKLARLNELGAKIGFKFCDSETSCHDELDFFQKGMDCYDGNGVPQDYAKAAEWFLRAAELGNSAAQHNLGVMHEHGQGVAQNDEKAFGWFHKSAENKFSQAQFKMAVYYVDGPVVAQDLAKAAEWMQKSAEQGLDEAQYQMAIFYEQGWGIMQDIKKAAEWFLKAANNKHAEAQLTVGAMHEGGVGFTQNYEKAAMWYRKAAEKGNEEAKNSLAELYKKGKILNKKKIRPIFEKFKTETEIPAVVLTATKGENLRPTDSKMGGIPYSPAGFEYPIGSDGEPLLLLAQLNFAQLPKLEHFPQSGILQFYISVTDDMYGFDYDEPTNQPSQFPHNLSQKC
jgi:TPR repeat protein